MKIIDFINFDSLGQIRPESIINHNLYDNYQTYSYDIKKYLPDKNETLLLIAKAKNSFLSYIKIKDKYIKDIYKTKNLQIFLSKDKKYYCVNFCYARDNNDEQLLDFVGIFEKKSGKFFAITFHSYSPEIPSYLCMDSNNYNIIDYFSDYDSIFEKDPLDIIVKLEDTFNKKYDEVYKQICNKIEEEEESHE